MFHIYANRMFNGIFSRLQNSDKIITNTIKSYSMETYER